MSPAAILVTKVFVLFLLFFVFFLSHKQTKCYLHGFTVHSCMKNVSFIICEKCEKYKIVASSNIGLLKVCLLIAYFCHICDAKNAFKSSRIRKCDMYR